MDSKVFSIPGKFMRVLEGNQDLYSDVLGTVREYADVLKENDLFFFEEYTDHGIRHIESVLECAARIISDGAMEELCAEDVAVLVLAVVLHDIGMHVGLVSFNRMLEGAYEGVRVKEFDRKSWRELWEEFLTDCKYFSGYQREMIWGDAQYDICEPDLADGGKLTGNDRKLIGEFIRRHHPRIAHEIALGGLWGNECIPFGGGAVDEGLRKIAGVVARSHGIAVRDTFGYLQNNFSRLEWKKPQGVSAVFLMAVLRVADYLQMDKGRASRVVLKLKLFGSPYSLNEHRAHLAVERVNFECEDPECILVSCRPEDSQMYVKLKRLVEDIQHELDMSWAVLGEVYGAGNRLGLRYRRICPDITEEARMEKLKYVPQKIAFKFNDELSKLLIAPLYGDHPTFGVRELVQNATDACLERDKLEELKGNKGYAPKVTVAIDRDAGDVPVFTVRDNGKGMTIKEIVDYFLTIGSSFRASKDWKRLSDEYRVFRNGRFGIGVLAAFLIGDRIEVRTRSVKDAHGYCFSAGLDDEFIEVVKDDTITEAGMDIRIRSSVGRIERMEQKTGDSFSSRTILWNEWYINERPEVEYFKFGVRQEKKDFFKGKVVRELKHSCQEFGRVLWSPINALSISEGMMLACNGIIITKNSCKNRFGYDDMGYYNFSIRHLPDLHVDDTYNNLPLKLDRQDIDRRDYVYPFEKELYVEVVKDFIAQLLVLDARRCPWFEFNENMRFQAEKRIYFILAKEGFSMSLDFFYRALKKKYSELFVFLFRGGGVSNGFDVQSMIVGSGRSPLFIPRFAGRDRDGWTKVLLYEGGQGVKCFLGSNKYDYRDMVDSVKRWMEGRNGNVEVVIERDVEHGYSMVTDPRYGEKFTDIRKLVNLYIKKQAERTGEKEFAAALYELPETPVYGRDSVLDDLLGRYFGDEDVMIPYDPEERRRKFPLAFEELWDYMKDYIKK